MWCRVGIIFLSLKMGVFELPISAMLGSSDVGKPNTLFEIKSLRYSSPTHNLHIGAKRDQRLMSVITFLDPNFI